MLHTYVFNFHKIPCFLLLFLPSNVWIQGPWCFDSLEIPLAHKHASFPITLGGIELILTTTIIATIYLGSFVISIIVVGFVVNQHPFLFELLAQINNTFLV
jgi:hypothetical protein